MREIKYELSNNRMWSVTDCPYGSKQDGRIIKVGTSNCSLCLFNQTDLSTDDKKNQTVICDRDEVKP